MPVTNQPTDQPYGQLITDQQTLERLFRATYLKWVADARKRLGDTPGAAPRVVSKAFHMAWQDRKRFHSQEELDAFLGANIQHGSAREISRIAGLHRMDAHGSGPAAAKAQHAAASEMSVDEAWDRLKHTLEGGAPEAYRERASTARHEAAEHVAALGKERDIKPFLLIGVAALVVALGAIWWINKAGESRAVDRALTAADVRKTETSYGQQVNITLDDGTLVRLAPQSVLTVPKRFGMTGGYRAVRVDGAANVEVTKASTTQPFEVRNGAIALVATGTKFVVRKYAEDAALILQVNEGTVEVRVGEVVRSVAKGNALAITQTGEMSVPSQEALDEARTWADGNVTIVGHPLRYVLPQLKRWYGLDIHVQDTSLLSRPVFVHAANNSPKEAISSVEKSGNLKFTYIGENMAFQDAASAAPAKASPTRTKAPVRRR